VKKKRIIKSAKKVTIRWNGGMGQAMVKKINAYTCISL
jgi:hypothetical protein